MMKMMRLVACLVVLIGFLVESTEAGKMKKIGDFVGETIDAPLPKTNRRRDKTIVTPPLAANHRSKRSPECGIPTSLSPAEQLESLMAHNHYRSLEPGADIFKLVWNENLAAKAQEWAEQCLWQHGMYEDCDGGPLGQNLYLRYGGSATDINITNAIRLWWEEKVYYDFPTGNCQSGQMCGHYTQVVWGTSLQVGCGFHVCPTIVVGGVTQTNGLYYACDYSPSGNWIGEMVYIEGEHCADCFLTTRSNATHPGYLCENGLCKFCAPSQDPLCSCGPADTCNSHGTWSETNCLCNCDSGWYGGSCQYQCANVQSLSNCVYWQGNGYCSTDSIYFSYMQQNCVATCSLCF